MCFWGTQCVCIRGMEALPRKVGAHGRELEIQELMEELETGRTLCWLPRETCFF